jgi:hypothetical protein
MRTISTDLMPPAKSITKPATRRDRASLAGDLPALTGALQPGRNGAPSAHSPTVPRAEMSGHANVTLTAKLARRQGTPLLDSTGCRCGEPFAAIIGPDRPRGRHCTSLHATAPPTSRAWAPRRRRSTMSEWSTRRTPREEHADPERKPGRHEASVRITLRNTGSWRFGSRPCRRANRERPVGHDAGEPAVQHDGRLRGCAGLSAQSRSRVAPREIVERACARRSHSPTVDEARPARRLQRIAPRGSTRSSQASRSDGLIAVWRRTPSSVAPASSHRPRSVVTVTDVWRTVDATSAAIPHAGFNSAVVTMFARLG